ncbi:MAG: BREX system ATP-binding domain-containing protein [Pseudomonadales bacterium]|nr:BREX system ATP-binding domain-containing protein [Pseudomonadales bacterium]
MVKQLLSTAGDRQALDRLRNEFAFTRLLAAGTARRALAASTLEGQPSLLFGDPGGVTLRTAALASPLQARVDLALALAREVARLHDAGVTHGDIAPDNVLIMGDGTALLIDLELATLEAQRDIDAGRPGRPLATLATLAPETSGRLRRRSDRRADLYSLGATLFELFADAPVFPTDDAVALVQSHIARDPPSLLEVCPGAPTSLARVIATLLAKRPEDRYQDARAVVADLAHIADRFASARSSADLVPAAGTVPVRFCRASEVVGRVEARRALAEALQRVANGSSEFVLLSGAPGIGKRTLVDAMQSRARHLAFDTLTIRTSRDERQQARTLLPLAFAPLLNRLAVASDADALGRVERIERELGELAPTMTEVLPELAALLPGQPAAPPLPPIEAEQRLDLAFLRLVRGIATQQAPLLLLIENCEQLDADGLARLALLMRGGGIPWLLVVATTDDPAVASAHLRDALDSRTGAPGARHVEVPGLDLAGTTRLVADSLLAPEQRVAGLATAVHAHVAGNPERAFDLLDALRRQGVLYYDMANGRWCWPRTLPAGALQGDHAEHVLERLARTAPTLLDLLRGAAVIGPEFRLDDLAAIAGAPLLETLARLREAVDDGLLLPLRVDASSASLPRFHDGSPGFGTPAFRFRREALRRALTARIDDDHRRRLHRILGERFLTHPDGDRARLRDGVQHLGSAAQAASDQHVDAGRLARLNLDAGRSALADAEPRNAYRFLRTGLGLLGADAWREDPELALALTLASMEAATLCGDAGQVERLGQAALMHLRAPDERMMIAVWLVRALQGAGRSRDAAAIALPELARQGLAPASRAGPLTSAFVLLRGRRLLARLERNPETTDGTPPAIVAAAALLQDVLHGAFRDAPQRLLAGVDRLLALTSRHPDVDAAPFLLACLGAMSAAAGFRDDARRYLRVAERLLDARASDAGRDPRVAPRTRLVLAVMVQPWLRPPAAPFTTLHDVQQRSFALGDAETAGDAAAAYAIFAVLRGRQLGDVGRELAVMEQTLQRLRSAPGLPIVRVYGAFLQRRRTPGREAPKPSASLDTEPPNRLAASHGSLLEAWLALDDGRPQQALAELEAGPAARLADDPGLVGAQYAMLHGLASIDAARSGTRALRRRALRSAHRDAARLRSRLARGLGAIGQKPLLLEAEISALQGRFTRAFEGFEGALREARANGFLLDETAAWRRCTRFLEQAGRYEIAARFAGGADDCERQQAGDDDDGPSPEAGTELLDAVGALLEATRAISGELRGDALVTVLFERLLARAGIARVALALQEGEGLQLHALAEAETAPMVRFPGQALEDCDQDVPVTLLQTVARTGERLIVKDSAKDELFSDDAYFRAQDGVAALCLPLATGERFVGVLFVERRTGASPFDAETLRLCEALASQAAVGLDNARLHDALGRARDQYRLLFDNALEGIFQLGLDGTLRIANDALAETLGYRSARELLEEVPRLPDDVAVEPSQLDGVVDAIVEHGAVRALEFEAIRRDGSRAWVELSARAVLDEAGVPIGIEGSLVDTTERRQRLLAERAREEAEGATRAKNYFLASMSHEIRTPMNAILGFSELALETELAPRQREYVHTIHEAARSLLALLDDVLDLSRIEAGRLDLVTARLDLVPLLRHVHALFVTRARTRGLRLELVGTDELEQALPAGAALLGDPGRLRQVLVNLVDNAVKFTLEGGVTLRARIAARDEAGLRIAFEVEDTGVGIGAGDRRRLFDPFEQLDAGSTRRHGGAGLGLAICRQLVNLMGGTLEVDGEFGVGSRFHFELRLPFAGSEAPSSDPPLQLGAEPLAGRSLLLAEDNRINQQLALEFLERAGARVTVTERGQGVLEILEDRAFDAILMDLHMPDLDGMETCRRLRRLAHGRDVPVIAVTADAVGNAALRAREAGFDDFVLKPMTRETLLTALARLLPTAGTPSSDASAAGREERDRASVPGIDLASGLRAHNGNEALFLRLLGEFQHHYGDAAGRVRRLLAEGREEEAARLVHNVHGVAGSFGAERLRRCAAELEGAMETRPGHVDRKLGSWESALREVLESAGRITRGDVSLRRP